MPVLWTMVSLPAAAQDVVFSHLLSAPLYTNPAFAGTLGAYHASVAARSPFMAAADIGSTVYADGDVFIASWQSSIGVYVLNDRFASGVYQTTSFGVAYAYAFRLFGQVEVRPALQAVFHLQQRTSQQWLFPDMVGGGGAVSYPVSEPSASRVDFAAGVLLSHPAFEVGAAVQHLGATAGDSLWAYGRRGPKGTAHARFPVILAGEGELLPLQAWLAMENIVLSPHVKYVFQGDYRYLIAGAAVRSGGLVAGAAVKTTLQNATYAGVLSVGVESLSLKAGYSFDFLAGGGDLRGWNSSSHELFLHYSFGSSDNRPQSRTGKRYRPLNPACGCPY
ncbi:MAG: type IX secretion system membrane protein PorP/SprF [Prevotellaceae bacterium]|jgi:type IX secretion system PorP/SprF family membrane protein|nr:type IX secretion system membrane protein PorP/SprF [Prevotellaceae bacterium]